MAEHSKMKTLRSLFHRETRSPLLAVMFASAIAVGLVMTRIVVRRDIHYSYLIWNLFLAWMPLLLALLACEAQRTGRERTWTFRGTALAWLLFFPNAPYIFTDVFHLQFSGYHHYWVDFSLILICAVIGQVLGFVSLYLMQSLVRRRWGQVSGWLFVAFVTALSGFGVYLGRFLRFNTWDVITRPLKLYHGVTNWATHPTSSAMSLSFPILFAIFLLLTYVMLYALTHLPRLQDSVLAASPRDVRAA